MEGIGVRMKELRKSLGLSQEKFGQRIKVSKSHISNIEIGGDTPSDMLVKLVCIEYNVNEEWLRYGTGLMKFEPFKEKDNAAHDIEESLLRLNNELQGGLNESYNLYGTLLTDSLNKLNEMLLNEPHANRALVMLSLKLVFDLLSDTKHDPHLQKEYMGYVYDLLSNLSLYNQFLNKVIIDTGIPHKYTNDDLKSVLSRHEERIIDKVRKLMKLHTEANPRFKNMHFDYENTKTSDNDTVYDSVADPRGIYETKGSYSYLPVIGRSAAGSPIEILEYNIGKINTNGKHSNAFVIQVSGDSMVDAGIDDGDYVVVKPQPEVENGEMALVEVDGSSTIKYFFKNDNIIELRPANDHMTSLIYDQRNIVRIKGKIVDIIKRVAAEEMILPIE